ncbi:hypothetical protein OL548_18495 [Lysinibacillus sp. MHQ-1]|nr:hypothetical protein OL548_18495 [Lysinibacillus sp. MHQ-1]
MNQFKEGLLKELQDVKFSQKRKQLIAEKARRKEKTSSRSSMDVSYRTGNLYGIGHWF